MKQVIGLVGKNGSGKGTVGELILQWCAERDISAYRMSFSEPLRKTLEEWQIEVNRHNLQTLPQMLEELDGRAGTLSRRVGRMIEDRSEQVVVLDGVRWMTDLAMLRGLKGSVLVGIETDEAVRYERMKRRGQKAGESEMSWQQFVDEEQAKTELSIPDLLRQADEVIENNGSEEELARRVREVLEAQFSMMK